MGDEYLLDQEEHYFWQQSIIEELLSNPDYIDQESYEENTLPYHCKTNQTKKQIDNDLDEELQFDITTLPKTPEIVKPTKIEIKEEELEEDIQFSRKKTKEVIDIALDIVRTFNNNINDPTELRPGVILGISDLVDKVLKGGDSLQKIHQSREIISSSSQEQIPGINADKAIIFSGNPAQLNDLSSELLNAFNKGK